MEKSAKSREGEESDNVALRKQEPLKDEPQKKKKLVYFEIDNCNNAQSVYEVSNFKIEELFRTPSKICGGGGSSITSSSDDGLAHGPSSTNRDATSITAKSCKLPVVSGDVSTIMFDEFGIDLIELQNRILELEKQLKNENLELPPIFSDLKSQVENFRNKLETAERYKRTELQKQPFCQRFQYRRTSSERGRKVRERFLNICEEDISESTKDWLKQPSFDTSQYEDEEILLFLQHMFFELGFISKFDIPVTVLRNFLYEVYKNYNEVPFHNFRHCFCVAQMMYVMIWSVDIPKRMGDLDTLILLTSCICHDLDHPGYNNIYQINARTELALLYNDISPLENHHCSVAFRILENPDCNIFSSLDKETFKEIREGIIRCILATDMARHNEILTQFKDVTPEFDFSNKSHKNLLSMILIKVADISNEARPMNVAEPWLDRLLMEFFKQSDAEKQEGLPVTPFMDRDKITKPSSQCSFIGFVLLPLFEALGELLPELHDLIIAPAKYALEHYKRLNEAAKDERMRRKSVVEAGITESNEELDGSNMVKSGSGHSVRSRRSVCNSCSQVRQRSKSSEEFEVEATPPSSPGALSGHNVVEDLEDLEEREEIVEEEEEELDEEEEPVTEVEVSEKTLKFKISTESSSTSFPGRKSIPGSRKGSRERNQYLENDLEWSRMMKDEDGRSLKRSITSDTMGSRKGSSDSEKLSLDKTSRKGSGESDKVVMEDGNRRTSSRSKEIRGKGATYDPKKKVEYRRKSLAVMERTRDWDPARRRKSISNTHEIMKKESLKEKEGEGEKKEDEAKAKGSEKEKKKIDDSILDKLDSVVSENRYSRDFETSCWGLQNLKRETTTTAAAATAAVAAVTNKPTVVVVNNALKNSLQKNIESEKSKSEDNLTIKNSKKSETSPGLENNISVSRTDESIEKQLMTGTLEKKKKLGSNGHLSILTRLKNLRDRMSFGSRESETGSDAGDLQKGPNSSAEKTGKSNSDNQNCSKECEDEEKSRTLPKTKKPNRTSGKMRKGWRALIGKSDGNSASSLEVLPPSGSPSPVHPNLNRRRRNSSMDEEKPRKTGETVVSLSERKKSSWLSSPKKSGFLSKIGRTEEENCSKNTFLNNLTSSFRKKGGGNNKNEDAENGPGSSSSMQEGSKPN